MLSSDALRQAVRNKLAEGLEIRRAGKKLSNIDDMNMQARPVLLSDKDGCEIKPHPDTRKKVMTMQIYCPIDEQQKEMGTTLYQTSLKGVFKLGSYCLEPVKTFPFIPNIGYAFVVLKAYHKLTGMSWHGRPKIHTAIDRPRFAAQHPLCQRRRSVREHVGNSQRISGFPVRPPTGIGRREGASG